MIDLLSATILARLRSEANQLARPEVRHATLDRLEAACNAIADGTARAVVKRGAPEMFANWRRVDVPIIPPRIEDYVLARQAIDRRDDFRSTWTGPVASTLRKEGDGMLAYIRAREFERRPSATSEASKRGKKQWWHLVDGIEDDVLRIRIMREISEGREAKKQVVALKAAVRMCSSGFDIDGYLRGESSEPSQGQVALLSITHSASPDLIRGLVERLTDTSLLGGFDLEYDGKRVRQRRTKTTLVEWKEMAALISLTEGVTSG